MLSSVRFGSASRKFLLMKLEFSRLFPSAWPRRPTPKPPLGIPPAPAWQPTWHRPPAVGSSQQECCLWGSCTLLGPSPQHLLRIRPEAMADCNKPQVSLPGTFLPCLTLCSSNNSPSPPLSLEVSVW